MEKAETQAEAIKEIFEGGIAAAKKSGAKLEIKASSPPVSGVKSGQPSVEYLWEKFRVGYRYNAFEHVGDTSAHEFLEHTLGGVDLSNVVLEITKRHVPSEYAKDLEAVPADSKEVLDFSDSDTLRKFGPGEGKTTGLYSVMERIFRNEASAMGVNFDGNHNYGVQVSRDKLRPDHYSLHLQTTTPVPNTKPGRFDSKLTQRNDLLRVSFGFKV